MRMAKKSVLLISYYFAPQNVIGAVRATKLAKYLARMGYEVTVLCGAGLEGLHDPTLERDLRELKDVHVVRERNLIRDYQKRKAATGGASPAVGEAKPASLPTTKEQRSLKARVLDGAYRLLRYLADRDFARKGLREIRRMNRSFDVVLSSYGPLSMHTIARRVKQSGMARMWIADFRDEVEMPFSWQKGLASRYVQRVRREADQISAVSEGIVKMMGLDGVGTRISNGFDREDLKSLAAEKPLPPAAFRFVYCGHLYAGQCDLTPFWKALQALMATGAAKATDFQVVYAGSESGLFGEQAQRVGLEALVLDCGMVNREESLALQKQADCLLLAAWNDERRTGVLTGKMLEYFMMEKPICGCVKGTLAQSETKGLLEGLGVGCCYEEANGEEDQPRLNAYIEDLWAKKRRGEALLSGGHAQGVEACAYPELAKRFAAWIEEGNE